MRKILLSLGLCFLISYLGAEVLEINDFRGGIFDTDNKYSIPDNCVSDALNVDFDEDYLVKKRPGIKLSSAQLGGGQPILSIYSYTQSDGDLYSICQSSTSLYSQLSGNAWAVFHSTVSTTTVCGYTTFMDKLFFGDGVMNLTYYDGSSVAVATTTYQPKYLATWQNRLWISGDSSNPSKVYCSAYLDYTDWDTSGILDTSPQSFDINSSDGKSIQGFFYSPNGNLGIIKNDSIWEIQGFDSSDFSIRLVSNNLGTVDGGYTYRNNNLILVSRTGIYEYDGNTFAKISDKIENTHNSILQLGNYKNGMFSKYNDATWQTYTSTYNITFGGDAIKNNYKVLVSSGLPEIVAGVYPTFYFGGDTSDLSLAAFRENEFDYYIDEYSNIYIITKWQTSESAYGGYISELKYNSDYELEYKYDIAMTSNTINYGIEDTLDLFIDSSGKRHFMYKEKPTASLYSLKYASSTTDSVWSVTSSTNIPYFSSVFFDSCIDNSGNFHIVYSSSPNIYYSSITSSGWHNPILISTYTVSGLNTYDVAIYISTSNIVNIAWASFSTSYKILFTSKTLASSSFSSVSLVFSGATIGGNSLQVFCEKNNNPYIIYYNNSQIIQISSNTASTGLWTTTNLSLEDDGYINGITDIKFFPYDNIFCMTYENRRTVSGSYVYNKKYVSYSVNPISKLYSSSLNDDKEQAMLGIKLNGSGNMYPNNELTMMTIDCLSADSTHYLNIFYSSYSYISEIYDTGIDQTLQISSFTILESLTRCPAYHFIRSSDSITSVSSTTFINITNNSTPSIIASRYFQYMAKNQGYYFSDYPNDLSNLIQRYTISSNQYNLSCENYKSRNYIGCSTGTFSNIDLVLVYDKNNSWTKYAFNGINFKCMKNIDNNLYFGSDDGYIYKFDHGFADEDSNINSYILTKDYYLESIFQYKTPDFIYFSGEDTGNSSNYLDFEYYFNGYYGNSSIPNYYSGSKSLSDNTELSNFKTNILNYKYSFPKRINILSMQFEISNSSTEELNLNNILILYRSDIFR